MGADMCVAYLVCRKGRKLDWPAGKRVIKNLKYDEENEDTAPVVTAASDQQYTQIQLLEFLVDVKNACAGSRRDSDCLEIAGNEILITGGMSWGDAPSDLYQSICNLDDVSGDILEAVGFHRKEDYKDWRLVIRRILRNKALIPLLLGLDKDLDDLIAKEAKR
jgi:hypothetical protein